MDRIRFLVVWLGSICNLKCKNCSNLIPYIENKVFDTDKIISNMEYITSSVHIDKVQIQGGEPCIYKDLSEVLSATANNKNIGHITVASNGTIMPDDKATCVLSNYPEKIDIRFSIYDCVNDRKRNEILSKLKRRGVNADLYNFLYGNGKWFDSGDVYNEFNSNRDEVFKIYKSCGNHDCWTLLDDYLVNCSKIYSLLQIHNLDCYEDNNMVNISVARERGDQL